MGNNPMMGVDPDGRIWHVLVGAVIGGVVNLGVKAFQGKIHGLGDGLAAFGIGAVGGAVTAATGGAIAGAAGLSMSTVAGGMVAGASGAVFGSPVQGMGNAMYFGDAYSGGQFLADVLAGGILGGVAGGVAGWLKNVKNIRNGGQAGDIWGFKSAGKGTSITFDYPEPIGAWGRDGQPLKEFAGYKFGGMEYLDEGLRMTEQAFAGGAKGGVSGLSKIVSVQKQARHLAGTAKQGGGFLNSVDDAQAVLDAVHSGQATFLGTSKTGHQVFRFNGVTGTNVNLGAGIGGQPTNVFIIKGTVSPSIVPTSPFWKP